MPSPFSQQHRVKNDLFSMKRKRREEDSDGGRPSKKLRVDSVNEDERRLQSNRSYLENIKNMISMYQKPKSNDQIIAFDGEEEMDEESDQEDLILETVKKDILEKRHLTEKLYDEKFKSCEILPSTFIRGHKNTPTAISLLFRINNKRAATVSKDNCMILWDLEKTGKKKVFKNVSTSKKGLLCISQSSDGTLLCCGGYDRVIYCIDPRTNSTPLKFDDHGDSITSLFIKPETFEMYSSSADKTLKFWDIRKNVIYQTLYGHHDEVHSVSGLPSQVHVVSASYDTTVRLWNVETQKQFVFEEGHVSPCGVVKMLHSDRFVSGGEDGSVIYWSTQHSNPLFRFKNAHGGKWVASMDAIPYSNVFFSGSADGNINVWAVPKNRPPKSGKGKVGKIEVELIRQVTGIEGWVNGMEVERGLEFMVCCVGREHRLGRWNVVDRKMKSGIHVIRFRDKQE